MLTGVATQGVVVVLEALRVLAEAKFAPANTLEFHFYSGSFYPSSPLPTYLAVQWSRWGKATESTHANVRTFRRGGWPARFS